MQTGAATVESSMEFPQNIKNGIALWPSKSASGNISEKKKTWNTNLKEYMQFYVHCSVVYDSEDLEVAQCLSIDEW